MDMQKTIFIAPAGLAGTLIRYWLAGLVARQYVDNFPWGTVDSEFNRKLPGWRAVPSC
jgi:fluoride ion exporter CrcB/FEX